jgi:hypothetical protein
MGCFLIYTGKDFTETVAHGSREALHSYILSHPESVKHALADPGHPNHAAALQFVLRNVDSKREDPSHIPIPASYKPKLGAAVALIASITPDALGIVKPATNWAPRRKDGSPSRQVTAIDTPGKLGHKTRGAAFAAELLVTAALIQKSSRSGDSHSQFRNSLKIVPGDRLDLGIKLQASYKDGPRIMQPRRKTVEADAFIQRPDPETGDTKILGIDVKHSMNAGTYHGKGDEFSKQIDGLVVALRAGEIHEYHFVTNGHFDVGVKELIEKANDRLQRSSRDTGVSMNSRDRAEVRQMENKLLTKEEIAARDVPQPQIFWHEKVWPQL